MRIIRTIIFLLVFVGLLWLLVLLFSKVFTSGNTTTNTQTSNLSSYARTDTQVVYIIDGPVRLEQDHRQLRISVDSSSSHIELVSGYGGSVLQQDTFENTMDGYAVFLRSLDTLGFSKGNTKLTSDERGQCPLRNRYVYQLVDNGTDAFRYWSTSCGTGTFTGNRSQVRTLFTRQIPADVLRTYTRDISLS